MAELRKSVISILSALFGTTAKNEQLAFVYALPTTMIPSREVFESMGLSFGDVMPGETLLTQCNIPEGWQIVPEVMSWSDLVDADGQKRARILCNPAYGSRGIYMWELPPTN